MASQARLRPKQPLLPSGLTVFFKRRLNQFIGLVEVGLATILAVSLASYSPLDPSWNLAIETPVKNKLAFPGAVVADALLQTFGVTAFFLVVALLGWGIRSMAGAPLRWTVGRIIALGTAALLGAGAAASYAPPTAWAMPNGLGGAFGSLLLTHAHPLIGSSWLALIILQFLFSFSSLALLLWGLGLSWPQMGKGIKTLGFGILSAFKWIIQKATTLSSALERPADKMAPSDSPPFLVGFQGASQESHMPSLRLSSEEEEEKDFPSFRGEERTSLKPVIHSPGPSYADQDAYLTASNDWEEGSDAPSLEPEETVTSITRPAYAYESPAFAEEYALPSLDLLDSSLRQTGQTIDPQILEESAYHLKTVLEEFGVRGEIVAVRPGPVVTMYELKPAAGIKTSRVIGLADDIARSMSALSARIAVIPGRNVIGIELPNPSRETVYLRELLQSESYEKSVSHLALILGKDIGGQPVIADLARMPHLLVAGTTGSGKSVAVNTMILSLLFRLPPDRCKFIMIDPKMLELSVYDGIPHLLSPVVTDPKKAVVALKWAVKEMESRYRAMSKLGVRNIDGYNTRVKEARQSGELLVRRVQTGFDPDSGKPIFENQPLDLEVLPYIVIVVDEMADLMLVAGKEIEGTVQRLAQMARAAGIHLIMATQRPSVDVITGTIKANFPTRISFQVTSKIDSRTILSEQGAEQLLGQGDMLYMAGGGRIMRVHGPFVRDDEVERVVAYLKMQGEPSYVDGVTEDEDDPFGFDDNGAKGGDALYHQAVELVLREGKASTSFIQRHLQIGYNKAAGIIELMEKNGVVSAANHVGKREVLR